MKNKGTILAIDDESTVLDSFKAIIESEYDLFCVETGEKAHEILSSNAINLVLLDILLADENGIDLLKEIKEKEPDLDVIMISALDNAKTAVEAMKYGAYDYLTKPVHPLELRHLINNVFEKNKLKNQVTYMKDRLERFEPIDKIITKNKRMLNIFRTISDIADSEGTVLILGESGTGKELIARAIHNIGNRKTERFVVINCAAIPKTLMESEIFGHKKGAFTGASSTQIGKLEIANRGIVFFDDIDTLDIEMQAKLLRVIEEKEIERIGSANTTKIDVKFIASSNKNLNKLVEHGKFREDLYYRLNVFPIELPPLRERREDIPLLIKHFLKLYAKQNGKPVKTISKKVEQLFVHEHDWPGNVRELKNVVERLSTITKGNMIYPINLVQFDINKNDVQEMSLKEAKKSFEKKYIAATLARTNGNRNEAARILKIHRNTLQNKLVS